MRKLGDQWVENGRMYKAVEGPKIVNGLMEGNPCHGCCYVGKWDDDCLNPNQACPVGKGVIIKDLGILNDGLLPCPFCGEYTYPEILKEKLGYRIRHVCRDSYVMVGTGIYETKQQTIDAWNRRTR